MKKNNSIDRTALMPNYAPAEFIPVKGKKSILWDDKGKDYIDFGGGIAVTCLGHSHPALNKVLKEQSTKLWHVSNYLYNKPALELSELLANKTFADKVFFSNSGNDKLFYDVIYNPNETPFLHMAKKLGYKTENGKTMFVYQALQAFKLWHKIEPKVNTDTFKLLDND